MSHDWQCGSKLVMSHDWRFRSKVVMSYGWQCRSSKVGMKRTNPSLLFFHERLSRVSWHINHECGEEDKTRVHVFSPRRKI